MASHSLYAPIIDSVLPAFVVGNKINITFALSAFNSTSDFVSVHLTMKKHLNSETIVNVNYEGSEQIYVSYSGMIVNLEAKNNNDGTYTITLPENILGAIPGNIYDCQIRLVEKGPDSDLKKYNFKGETSQDFNNYLSNTDNANHFSEWSTICVLKATSFANITYEKNNISVNHLYDFYTRFRYENLDGTEPLYYYNIIIKKNGIQYGNENKTGIEVSSNVFEYMPTTLPTPGTYSIELTGVTINGLMIHSTFLQTIEEGDGVDSLSVIVPDDTVAVEEDKGVIKYKFEGKPSTDGRYILRRRDTKYSNWETLKNFKVYANQNFNMFQDYTAESENFYEYVLQRINEEDGRRSAAMPAKPVPVLREFEYSYLIGKDGRSLKIALDTSLNSFKINTNDSIVKTIGSQYPFINRTGNNYYKSFSLSGIISFNLNEDFCSNLELYGQDYHRYNDYILNSGKELKYSHLHEKKFRDKVYEFLYDGMPKLYKSAQEGNILVVLSDINFSPTTNLGRLTYSFNCNITEIGSPSIENLDKYRIWSINSFLNADYYKDVYEENPLNHPYTDPYTHEIID